MSNQPVVKLENVTKRVAGKTLVRDLTFSVQRGEVYGFLGPNGSGKTTTIRMIVGLSSITEGEIYVEGYNIKKDRSKAMAHVGAIVENPELYGYMTGMQNMIHFARMAVQPVSKERIHQIIDLVELSGAINQKVKTYSLGMRQRLGIAQALLHNPSILILDEPTNGLDPAGIRQLRDYLRELAKRENIAVLVSSHLLSEVELMCDRALVIQEGQFIEEMIVNNQVTEVKGLSVEFEVESSQQAVDILLDWTVEVMSDKLLLLQIEKSDIPVIVQRLVENSCSIYQIKIRTKSLEDRFLALTKGGK
ncbi:ABC transporter ATP-binding protein [Brevibacillus laterosporus]|uniref:ABC transporter ATP-binding protein n=1 Tax=Brevibacillus laterosporus TaxID=1465 RepID=A0AAP8QEQ2_BRELA|nr:ABC transporter ATP-binding protein [Brevibacillus laterosporus]MED1662576.1 ABC transporter ATP-binding protein [Brevibacillus laterosporus]MED1667586.1 ABC transporter ATP-binding protein [Brevibacillus laterosporus]MED1718708.1 ABC transporter ATP-binding protein [Brevibacillus laterosporus]PPA80819.1 ABC transporter ATP-binding protein [Brevibacillus laterosporus]PPB08430.1 ABC transporter ATP-binding protein [Brevibacillus laterosporus]